MKTDEMNTRRRVFLMRHGEVTYFDANRPPLSHTEVGLSAEGRAQALAAGALLANAPIELIVTSPLRRTQETADLVLGERSAARRVVAGLEEVRPGPIHEIPLDQIQGAMVSAFHHGISRETKFLGGETFGQFCDRVEPCWDALVADRGWQSALVVAHGGVNRAILCRALGSGLAGFGRIEQDPACLNIIDVDDHGRAIVRLLNFTPYNAPKHELFATTMERLYDEFCRFLASQS